MFTWDSYLETLETGQLQEIFAEIRTAETLLANEGLEISDLENPLDDLQLYYWDEVEFSEHLSRVTDDRDLLLDCIGDWVEDFPPNSEATTVVYLTPYGSITF